MSNRNADRNDCRHETLALSDMAHVQRCTDCGCISIHIGAVTLRVDHAGLAAIAASLGEASAVLESRRRKLFAPTRGLA